MESFTILTTTADDFMGEVHDRMPITLNREVWPVWLDPEVQDADALQSFLIPNLEAWQRVPVSSFVNSVKHDSPECIKLVQPE